MLVTLLLLPFAGSILSVFFLRTASRRLPAGLAGLVVLFSLLLTAAPMSASLRRRRRAISNAQWLPQLGLDLTLRMDDCIVFRAIPRHRLPGDPCARYYMSGGPVPRFFSFLLAFMGAMLGIVISGNVILLSVFWELTSVFSFLPVS